MTKEQWTCGHVGLRAATYRAVGPLSDETPKAMRPPAWQLHRGFCFSGLKRP